MPPSTSTPFSRLRKMSVQEARRRSSWARYVSARIKRELPHGLEAELRGVPGLFAPGAFGRLYGPGTTGFLLVDEIDPNVTLLALLSARSVRQLLGDILSGRAPNETDEAPLDELEAGAAHFAAAKIAREISGQSLYLGVVLTELDSLREALGREVWDHLGLELRAGASRHRIDLLRRGPLPVGRTLPPRESVDRITLTLSLSAGFVALSLREMSTLAPGDAVVLDHASEPGGALLLVPGTSHARRVRLEGRRAIVGENVDIPYVHSKDPMEAEPLETRPLSDARVDVSAELGRIAMRVGEIERLAEGEVLHLGVDVGEAVLLRAGDVILARGELIDVDGRLAVLVRSLGG